jgi:hypothetical protein
VSEPIVFEDAGRPPIGLLPTAAYANFPSAREFAAMRPAFDIGGAPVGFGNAKPAPAAGSDSVIEAVEKSIVDDASANHGAIIRLGKAAIASASASGGFVFSSSSDPRSGDGSILTVYDATEAHGTPATALSLPNLPDVQVRGQTAPNGLPEMYRVPIDADTRFLQFALRSLEPSPTHPDHLLVFDQTGSPVANFAMTSDRMVVGVRPVNSGAPTQLYVAVTQDDADPTSTPSPYLLEIQRLPEAEVDLATAGAPTPTLTMSFDAWNPFLHLPDASEVSAEADQGPALIVGLGPSQGPLPVREPGPEGGLFSAATESAAARAADPASIELALLDIWREEQAGYWEESRSTKPAPAPWLGIALPVVVPMRGPGGAAVWATAPPSLAPTVFVPPAAPEFERSQAAESRPEQSPLSPLDAMMEDDEAASSDRVVRTGMSVAATISLGLVLPDVVAFVDALRRRRLRQVYGLRRGPARG